MKHTTRMFLIPEDLYSNIFSQFEPHQDGSALGMVQSKMHKLAHPTSRINSDERAIQYDQEYKRYSKLQRENEEKPFNVKLQNVNEIVDNIPRIIEQKTKIYTKKVTSKKPKRLSIKPKIQQAENVFSEDEYEDVKEEFPGSSTTTPRNYTERRKMAMEYIQKNIKILGVNEYGQILQSQNPSVPIKTSNVASIIDHIINNNGVRRRPLPPGYEKFTERISAHPNLLSILGLKKQGSQSGSGGMILFKKVYNKPHKSIAFKFKPTLWSFPSKK